MPHAAKSRPLSPHLQVYRLPLAAWLSISHRITGIGLTLGLLLLAAWVISAAYGPEAYGTVSAFAGSPIGYLVMFGFSGRAVFPFVQRHPPSALGHRAQFRNRPNQTRHVLC